MAIASGCAGPRPSLVTTGEASHWHDTGRYAEALRLCRDFARSYAGVRCDQLGETGEGRPIVALHVSRGARHPVVYFQGGIHAGEIEGKDAGFWFLRDVLDGVVLPGALDAVDLVFVPVVNPDGHEQVGPNNRPNQRGPAQMGFRTNGARLNINRDYVKADTPEMHALLSVYARYQPTVLVDLHTTDGAKFEQDISVNAAPVAPRADGLETIAAQLSAATVHRLAELGNLPIGFYPSFVTNDDPSSGFAISEAPPRFSQFYAAARSRLGVLIETHSWRTYAERALSTYRALQAITEAAIAHGRTWQAAEAAADRADQALGGHDVVLDWTTGPHATQIEFRGYAYTKAHSELSGSDWIVYDEHAPQIWKLPLFDQLVAKTTIHVPRAGYLIDGGFARQVAAVLASHGLRYFRIAGEPRAPLEVYRATKVSYQPPFEGRTPVVTEGAWTSETRTLQAGAIYVPIAQPGARLVLHLLEPALPDSLTAWGSFNAVFERKEYLESYVAEQAARDLLAADPTLQAKFDAALAADPAMAASPQRRLDWFYQRHASWDERVNLLPIYRVDAPPPLDLPTAYR
ncbi:MAG TPA: M14 family zinc carboxypeptidase [Kofleriaceae bacterium]